MVQGKIISLLWVRMKIMSGVGKIVALLCVGGFLYLFYILLDAGYSGDRTSNGHQVSA